MKNDPDIHIAGMMRQLAERASGSGVKETDIPGIAQDIMRKKRIQLKPEIAGHSAEGQMMLDQFGRKAIVMPDGTMKEVA
jgi:hypothetical protein